MIKLVLYDAREKSATYKEVSEFFLGEQNPILVQIPNVVYHGFKCISETEAIVINCPTEPTITESQMSSASRTMIQAFRTIGISSKGDPLRSER